MTSFDFLFETASFPAFRVPCSGKFQLTRNLEACSMTSKPPACEPPKASSKHHFEARPLGPLAASLHEILCREHAACRVWRLDCPEKGRPLGEVDACRHALPLRSQSGASTLVFDTHICFSCPPRTFNLPYRVGISYRESFTLLGPMEVPLCPRVSLCFRRAPWMVFLSQKAQVWGR